MNARRFIPLAGALCLSLLASGTPGQPFKLEDLRRLARLSDPQISPDGTRIAVIVSRPNWETDKSDQELDLVDARSGALRPLTFKRMGLGSPRWSPGGKRLAFLAQDPDTKKAQLFVMPMDGGDPQRLTDGKQGVASFAWSPDGQRIAFYRQDDVDEKAIKEHRDALRVTDNNYMTRTAEPPWHVWVVPAAGGKAERLTEGAWSAKTDQDPAFPLAWSRDGQRIAFTKFPGPYTGSAFRSVLESVGGDGKDLRPLAEVHGATTPQFSPDGRALAYLRPRHGDQNNGNDVYVQTPQGTVDATRDLARNFNGYVWLPDGSGLLLNGADRAQSCLWRQPLQGQATKVALGDIALGGFSVARTGAVAFVGATARHPGELYVLDALKAQPRQLTHLNGFVDDLRLGRSEEVTWKNDGFLEDGILTHPVDEVAGRSYPMVLLIHGGPEGESILSFNPLAQLLAAKGFLVFEPNYRGSTNLGDAYQHAIYRDTGEGPGRDVMAGIAAVKKLGGVDAARIGISGWSYGGYMTSWLSGRYPGWRAAVSGAALNDWLLDYTIAYYQEGDLYFFGGSPYGKDEATAKLWREQSPIALAGKVTTPTLIMGDAGDPNVPIVNSYEMYHALKDHGVPVEFYVYPADTHFPGDIVHTTDVYGRWVAWMEKYLK